MLIDIPFWKKFANKDTKVSMLGYLDANKDIVSKLETILATKATFAELNEELTKFCDERNTFIKYASENHPQS